MNRTEAIRKIENCINTHHASSDRKELFNFQPYGFSDDDVCAMLKEVVGNGHDIDPLGEFSAVQAILVFEPSQERARADACRYLGDYTEAEFIEEFKYIGKINDIFENVNMTDEEIRAAFRKV